MTWNHRVVKYVGKDCGIDETFYEIREAYYNQDGKIWAITENATGVFGENIDQLKVTLDRMTKALEQEVIDLETYVFAKPDFNDEDIKDLE